MSDFELEPDLFGEDEARVFTQEEEDQKRYIYEKMSPRRKRFVERIGYDRWDPFQLPKEPLDLRKDVTERTSHELVKDFMKSSYAKELGPDYARGALESAVAIVNKDSKFRGVYDFCLWYYDQLNQK